MDVDPQAVINALSVQIGALQTENTILKMALSQVQAEAAAAQRTATVEPLGADEEETKKKK